MDTQIREHLTKYYQSKGWGDSPNDTELIEILTDASPIWKREENERRWWIEYRCVVEIDGMFIGFIDARTTGDENSQEKGFEFDPNTVCEMQKKTALITVTEYEIKNAQERITNARPT